MKRTRQSALGSLTQHWTGTLTPFAPLSVRALGPRNEEGIPKTTSQGSLHNGVLRQPLRKHPPTHSHEGPMHPESHIQNADRLTIREYRDADWSAVCTVHDRARPDELRGSCDPRAFVPLAEEQDDAASFQRSRKFVACVGAQLVGFVGVDGTYLSWLYV